MAELRFEYDKKTILDLCDARIARGDFLGALNALKRIDGEDKRLLFKKGDLYYKLTDYAAAAECFAKYLNLAAEKEKPRAYNALGAAFLMLNEKTGATYYFNKQIESGEKIPYDYGDEMYDFFNSAIDYDSDYYVAYPYDRADFRKLLIECDDLFQQERYEEVLEKIEIIPKENVKYYPVALEQRALCEFMLNEDAAAIRHIRAALKLAPTDVTVVCNAASMLNRLNKRKEAEAALSNVNVNELSGDELFKIISVNCDLKNDGTAASLVKKYLKTEPYDLNALMIAGISNYNLKNYAAAYEYFKTIFQITESYVSGYYLKMCEAATRGKPLVKEIEFSFDIPPDEKERIISRLKFYAKTEFPKPSKDAMDELFLLTKYAFESNDYSAQSRAFAALASQDSDYARDILASKLLSINVYREIKTGILSFLSFGDYAGEVPAFFGFMFRKVNFLKTDFKGENAPVFRNAFSFCFSQIAPFREDVSDVLASAEALLEEARNTVLDFNDSKALAAVIFENSQKRKGKSLRDLARFFMTTPKDMKRIKEAIKSSAAQNRDAVDTPENEV